MKKLKAKWATLLAAVSCFAVCLGVGVVGMEQFKLDETATAQAETTYTTHELGVMTLNTPSKNAAQAQNKQLYLLQESGAALPYPDSTWSTVFVYESGDGFKVNGTSATLNEMKSTDGGLFLLFSGVNVGDVVSISGTFVCEDKAAKYVISESKFVWNGTSWNEYIEMDYTEYNVTALTVHIHSSAGNANANNTTLWLHGTGDTSDAWATYNYMSGAGVKLNGVNADIKVQDFSGGLYLSFAAVSTDDVVSIGGTFVNTDRATKYIITDSSFKWNGSGWEVYVETPEVTYTEYTVSDLTVHLHSTAGNANANNTSLWISMTGGATVSDWPWFVYESGEGFKVNGATASLTGGVANAVQDFGGGIYFTFAAVNSGDVVSIGGVYSNADLAIRYTIPESSFKWNGSGWEVYVEKNYTEYTASNLTVHTHSTAGNTNANNTSLWISMTGGATLSDWPWFVYESGAGFKVNGETASLTGGVANAVQDFGGGIYFTFAAVNSGDVVSIGGAFVNDDLGIRYNIPEAKFQWNGSGWVAYVEYTTHELGVMTLNEPSKNAAQAQNAQLYLLQESGEALPYPDSNWNTIFVYESGNGLKVNGEAATLNEMKSTDLGLYLKFTGVNEGDVVSISGTFVCEDKVAKYVIEESKFVWNGSVWEEYVAYTEYTLSNLQVASTSKAGGAYVANNVLSLTMTGGATVSDWPWFVYESGAGFKVNGSTASLTGNVANAVQDTSGGLYFQFNGVNSGDIVLIGGVFVNEDLAIRYNIPETQFTWNGTEWAVYVPYTEYTISNLQVASTSKAGGAYVANNVLSLTMTGGATVSDWPWFVYESGAGFKVNDATASLTGNVANAVQDTSGGLYFQFNGVSVGDVVSIGGVFTNEDLKYKYNIEETQFIWMGNEWISYIEFTTYNVGSLVITTGISSATAVYFDRANGEAFTVVTGTQNWEAKFTFLSGSGNGLTLNGAALATEDIKIPDKLYIGLGTTMQKGDVLKIGGTYYNLDYAVKYVIEESAFMWNGSSWTNAYNYTDEELAFYDTVSISDIGLGVKADISATAAIDNTALSYVASTENTTGSVKFRFGFNSTDITAGVTEIRLRGTAWQGIRFLVGNGQISSLYKSLTATYALNSNTDYIIELGAIDLSDGENIWIYAKVDGDIVISDLAAKTETNPNEDGTPTFGTFTTNSVSCYFGAGVYATLTDPDHVEISYVTSSLSKTVYDYANKNSEYTLLEGKSFKTFVGWVVNGKLYFVGDTIDIGEENLTATALELDFRLEDGAAIRLGSSADESGIRFTTLLKEADLNTLKQYADNVSYGTLILPYDYLGAGQKPNLENFTSDEDILKIESTATSDSNKWEVTDGYVVYRGAMQKLYTENYERLFAGRGYMEITVADKTITVYTPFDKDENVRSVRSVAQAFKADTSEPAEGEIRYSTLSDTRKAIVDTYAASDSIDLMNYASYAMNNFLTLIAWNYPALDESNNYNNAANIAIADQMKATGVKVVNLTGINLLVINTEENIEKTRQIIKFFWSQGLQTVAYAANNFGLNEDGSFANLNCDFTEMGTPDFSDCEGFLGFLYWDEPTEDDSVMAQLAAAAIAFDKVYAGTDVTYMVNLLPSYAPYFQTEETSWWGGTSTTLNKAAYQAYVEEYCTTVLSQIKGEKWLSVDTYPINKDYSLHDTFLFDLGSIKYYAMQYGAHAHVALQSSGFASFKTEDDGTITITNDTKSRIPTEAEMRMQAYAAMAFGMDSLSWFTYSPSGSGSEVFYTFVNNDGEITDQTAYNAFKAVNTELNAIGSVYSAFDWKGIILGAGTDNGGLFTTDQDYAAFEAVTGQIGDYELSASDTKHLSSVATSETDWNYLMGVMEDKNGNEGYVLCNYNSHEEDRAQTITLKFASNITEVVIYRGGVATTVTVSNKTLTVDLATGEGVIILPSKLG